MKSNSTGRAMCAGQVGHEHERALEHADQQRGPTLRSPAVIWAPSSATRAASSLGADHDPPEVGDRRPVPRTRRRLQPRGRSPAANARGGPSVKRPAVRAHPPAARRRRWPRHSCRATASTRSTAAASRRVVGADAGASSQARSGPARQRPARRPAAAAASVGSRAAGQRSRQRRSSSRQELGLAGQHGHDVALGRRRRAAAAPRGGPGCGGSAGRRSMGSTHRLQARARRRAPRSRPGAGRAAGGARSRRMPARPSRPGAPEEVEQHRLGLVVGGVAGEHVGGQRPRSGPARARASRFGPGSHRRPARPGTPAPSGRGRGRHHVGLGRRAGPEAVVDVDGGDLAARRRRRARAGRASRRPPETAHR